MFRTQRFPFFKQLVQMDFGPTYIRMIAKYYGRSFQIDFLRKKSNITSEGISLEGINEALKATEFHILTIDIDFNTLKLPCINHWRQS